MNTRKTVAMVAAGTMMLSPLAGGAAMLAYTPTAFAETASTQSGDYPAGVMAYYDGGALDGFDPSANGVSYDATGRTVQLSGVPSDWTVQWAWMYDEKTGRNAIMYLLEHGETEYRYWFDGAAGAVHTVEELHGMTITLNGNPVEGDITQGFTVHDVSPSATKGYESAPYGWVLDGDAEDDHYTYTAHPDGSDTPSVTYTFLYDDTKPHDGISSLKNLKAYLVSDNSEVEGFDYSTANTGTTPIPMDADVRLEGVPEGWTSKRVGDTGTNNIVYTLTGPHGDEFVYMFNHSTAYGDAYQLSDLAYVRAFIGEGMLDGFDYKGGSWTLPKGVETVRLINIPDGWNDEESTDGDTIIRKVSSPDGKVNVEYRFTVQRNPASTDDLKDVKAIVGGRYVEGFKPTESGTYGYEEGDGIKLVGYPSDWTETRTTEGDTIVFTLSKDGVSVTYRFEKQVKPNTVDELSRVSASTEYGYVDDFEPTKDGTYTIPADAETIQLDGIPSDWTKTKSDDGLSFTLTSPDGKIHVTYTFQRAKHVYSADDLADVTATLDDGNPVEGFDPVAGGEFSVPDGTTGVNLDHIPSGWTATPGDGLSFDVTSADGTVTVSYRFVEKASYTVSFDTDGGDGVPSQAVRKNGRVEKPEDPSKTGYEFDGWYDGDTPYDFDKPVTGNLTLTAKWRATRHTVTFDTAGGSDLQAQTVAYGEKATKPADPTRDGWEFDGWLLDGRAFSFDTPITGDVTLTAAWRKAEVKTHTVTFKGAGDDSTRIVVDGERLEPPTMPVRDGYTFDCWYADGTPYDFTAPVTGDLTLEAHWIRNTYTVSFDANGGTDVNPQKVAYGDKASTPDVPTRDGYEFAGWYLDDAPYDFSTPVESNIMLKAAWKTKEPTVKTHTVRFDTDGGSKVEDLNVKDGTQVAKPADPVRDGYEFTGWTLDGTPYDFTTPVTGDLTLKASWRKLAKTHTVSFDLTGGEGSIPAQKVEDGSKAVRPADPKRDGYLFAGWSYEGGEWDFSKPVESDLTLKAMWERRTTRTHTVSFDTAGGSKVEAQTVNHGDKAMKPADPKRDGWKFQGWYLNGKPYDFTSPVETDVTLTARWEKSQSKTYKVMFDTGNGSGVPAQTVEKGDTASKPKDPTLKGFTFKGWTLDGKPYDFTTPVNADITLTARWEQNEVPPTVRTHKVVVRLYDGKTEEYDVADGDRLVLPANPTRDGYVFKGLADKDGKPYDMSSPVKGDLTLECVWEKSSHAGSGSTAGEPSQGSPAADASAVSGSDSSTGSPSDDTQSPDGSNPLASTGSNVLGVIAAAVSALVAGVGLLVARLRGREG